MTIYRPDSTTLTIAGIEPFLCELFAQIIPSADPSGSEAARRRLFSSPSRGAVPELDEDWTSLIEPELRRLFQSALEVVRTDLAPLAPARGKKRDTLHLPVANLESWVHALNQARLTLTARYAFTEQEMEALVPEAGEPRAYALFQVHFYGFLQECFLRELEES